LKGAVVPAAPGAPWLPALAALRHARRPGADARPVAAADIISAVEFDFDGQHLATGDRGGRVVLFEKVNTQPVSRLRGWPRASRAAAAQYRGC
jgi:serine/threonine-protein phosphatase 2A regulatory subunit B